MGELRHALRAYAAQNHPPHILLQHLDHLLGLHQPGWTATVCIALVEPGNARVHVANAGHLPPLLIDPRGAPHYVIEHGPLLGLGLRQPIATTHAVEAGNRHAAQRKRISSSRALPEGFNSRLTLPSPQKYRELLPRTAPEGTLNPVSGLQGARPDGPSVTKINERQTGVKIPLRASFQRQDIARNAHSAHHAHPSKPQVSDPLRQVQGSPRTPHGGSSGTGRRPAACAACSRPP
ncbi:PP2C family protein-serine/threonine phosphatase [Streptomyces fuscigenes]|uniref:PP2C family protein-serine/threonine phosphatase n=1 Tax=Streptomyces fuscigenes TaxID=1528880 RepID=UPI003557972F